MLSFVFLYAQLKRSRFQIFRPFFYQTRYYFSIDYCPCSTDVQHLLQPPIIIYLIRSSICFCAEKNSIFVIASGTFIKRARLHPRT